MSAALAQGLDADYAAAYLERNQERILPRLMGEETADPAAQAEARGATRSARSCLQSRSTAHMIAISMRYQNQPQVAQRMPASINRMEDMALVSRHARINQHQTVRIRNQIAIY